MYEEEIPEDKKSMNFPEDIQYQNADIMQECCDEITRLFKSGKYIDKCWGVIIDTLQNMKIILSLNTQKQREFTSFLGCIESKIMEAELKDIVIKVDHNTIIFNIKHESYYNVTFNVKYFMENDHKRMQLYSLSTIRMIMIIYYEIFKLNSWFIENEERTKLGYTANPVLDVVILPSNGNNVRFIMCGQWAIRGTEKNEFVQTFYNPLLCISNDEENLGLIISGMMFEDQLVEQYQFFNKCIIDFFLQSEECENNSRIQDPDYEYRYLNNNAFIKKKNQITK
jgi:hypothetical protein